MTVRTARTLLSSLLLMMVVHNAQAETVNVKYHGAVHLDAFSCTYTSSSFVNRICYRAQKQYLVVLLGQTYDHYCRLPSNLINQWLAADSKGRFYNARIKGEYDCRLGGVPLD